MLHDSFTAFFPVMLPLLQEKIGFSLLLAGTLPIALRLPNLLNPLIGSFSDRFKLKYFVASAPVIAVTSMTLMGVATNYATLFMLLLIAGFGSTFIHVPSPVLVKKVSGPKKGLGMSFYMLGGELARSVGPLIITAAISYWTLEGVWRLIPVGICLSFLILLKINKVEKDSKAVAQTYLKNDSHKEVMKYMLPIFATVAGVFFFQGLMKQALVTFLPTYMKSTGSTIFVSSIALSIMQFAGAVGTFTAGTISDYIGRKYALLIMAVLSPIFMILYTYTSGTLALVLLALLGFFMFFTHPIILAFVHDRDTNRQSFVNGVYMTINFVIASIASFAIGFLGDRIDLVTTFRIGGYLAFGMIPVVLTMKNKVTPIQNKI
jgi:FSR family fosmidomycin resistance protein-like MFS transporter